VTVALQCRCTHPAGLAPFLEFRSDGSQHDGLDSLDIDSALRLDARAAQCPLRILVDGVKVQAGRAVAESGLAQAGDHVQAEVKQDVFVVLQSLRALAHPARRDRVAKSEDQQ